MFPTINFLEMGICVKGGYAYIFSPRIYARFDYLFYSNSILSLLLEVYTACNGIWLIKFYFLMSFIC